MPFDPFVVEVITKERTTTVQKILTAVLTVYFFASSSSVAIALYFITKSR